MCTTQTTDSEQDEATTRASSSSAHTLISLGITEVTETYDPKEANGYLKRGWWLLASAAGGEIGSNPRVLYVLGKPQNTKKWCFK